MKINARVSLAIAAQTAVSAAALAQVPDCVVSSGIIQDPQQTCYFQPDAVYLTVYKLGLCTAQPGAPSATTAADLSSCTTVYQNDNPSPVAVIKGAPTALPAGNTTTPAAGHYTYAFIVVAPQFDVKTKATFASAMTAVVTLNSGTTCWTTGVGTDYVYEYGNTNVVDCGTSAAANPAHSLQVMNSFAPRCNSNNACGSQNLSYQYGPSADGLTAYLVTDAYTFGVTTDVTATQTVTTTITKLLGVQTLDATINAATTGIDIAFNAGQGATAVHPNGAPNQLAIIGGGPFRIYMTMK